MLGGASFCQLDIGIIDHFYIWFDALRMLDSDLGGINWVPGIVGDSSISRSSAQPVDVLSFAMTQRVSLGWIETNRGRRRWLHGAAGGRRGCADGQG